MSNTPNDRARELAKSDLTNTYAIKLANMSELTEQLCNMLAALVATEKWPRWTDEQFALVQKARNALLDTDCGMVRVPRSVLREWYERAHTSIPEIGEYLPEAAAALLTAASEAQGDGRWRVSVTFPTRQEAVDFIEENETEEEFTLEPADPPADRSAEPVAWRIRFSDGSSREWQRMEIPPEKSPFQEYVGATIEYAYSRSEPVRVVGESLGKARTSSSVERGVANEDEAA